LKAHEKSPSDPKIEGAVENLWKTCGKVKLIPSDERS
jgi:hypothetical protein